LLEINHFLVPTKKLNAQRILAVFPHPDDEVFGPGGTVAKYAQEGVAVRAVIFTYGYESHPWQKEEITQELLHGPLMTVFSTNAFDVVNVHNYYFPDMEINGSANWTLGTAMNVAHDVLLASGTLHADSYNINVAGDWNKTSGSFNAGSGTVEFLDDADHTSLISGSTTFNNLTVTEAGRTLIIDAGRTETITGALTLIGTAENPIIIMSNDTGKGQWNISCIEFGKRFMVRIC